MDALLNSYIHNPFVINCMNAHSYNYYKQRHNDYCYHLQTKGYYSHYLIRVLYHISIFYKSIKFCSIQFLNSQVTYIRKHPNRLSNIIVA